MILRRNQFALFRTMVRRDIRARYQGTLFGIFWNLLNPLLMLAIYSSVFLLVFKARWHMEGSEEANYALMLFVGILTHAFMAEVLTSCANVVRNNSNLVKKVVFPVEILPLVNVSSAGVNYLLGLGLTLIFAISQGYLGQWWVLLYLPLILLIYMLTLCALGYLFAVLGLYIRDVVQMLPMLITILMFTSTVFFSVHSAPASLGKYLYLNPISVIADSIRAVLYGMSPDRLPLLILFIVSCISYLFTYTLFRRLQPSFSDAL
ncbi:ABC transporter permease [Vibrio metschnikovii]|uniref:ABC transporter permease n=1 Tax=Vibrio metschnikovii TaxID=28172 RepID=UPI002FC89C8D